MCSDLCEEGLSPVVGRNRLSLRWDEALLQTMLIINLQVEHSSGGF